jgi:hypothetical protein
MTRPNNRYEAELLDGQWLLRRHHGAGWYVLPSPNSLGDIEDLPDWRAESVGAVRGMIGVVLRDFLEFEPVCLENVVAVVELRFGKRFEGSRWELTFGELAVAVSYHWLRSAELDMESIWQGEGDGHAE